MKLPKSVWLIVALLGLLAQTLQAYPPAPASQAQVNEGVQSYLYITPATLRGLDPTNYPNLGGGSSGAGVSASNVVSILNTNLLPYDEYNLSAELVPPVTLTYYGTSMGEDHLTNFIQAAYDNKMWVSRFLVETFYRETNGVLANRVTAASQYTPSGITNLVKWCHNLGYRAVCSMQRYIVTDPSGYSPTSNVGAYTPEMLAADMQTYKDWGFDDFAFDHMKWATYSVTNRDHVDQVENYTANIILGKLFEWGRITNVMANYTVASDTTRHAVRINGISPYPSQLALVNGFSFGGDIWANSNYPDGPYTGVQSENNLKAFANFYKTYAGWVKPGRTIFGLEVYTQTPDFEATNHLNVLFAMAIQFDIYCKYFAGDRLATTNTVTRALTNLCLRDIHQDKNVKMAVPVFSTNNVEIWAGKPLVDGRETFLVWNHNTNGPTTNVSFLARVISPKFNGKSAAVFDPWAQAYISTNSVLTFNLAPMQTLLLTAELLNGGGGGASINGLARNITGAGVTQTAVGDGTYDYSLSKKTNFVVSTVGTILVNSNFTGGTFSNLLTASIPAGSYLLEARVVTKQAGSVSGAKNLRISYSPSTASNEMQTAYYLNSGSAYFDTLHGGGGNNSASINEPFDGGVRSPTVFHWYGTIKINTNAGGTNTLITLAGSTVGASTNSYTIDSAILKLEPVNE